MRSVKRNNSIIFSGYGIKYSYDVFSGGILSKGLMHITQLGLPSITSLAANPADFPYDSAIYTGFYLQEFEYVYAQ